MRHQVWRGRISVGRGKKNGLTSSSLHSSTESNTSASRSFQPAPPGVLLASHRGTDAQGLAPPARTPVMLSAPHRHTSVRQEAPNGAAVLPRKVRPAATAGRAAAFPRTMLSPSMPYLHPITPPESTEVALRVASPATGPGQPLKGITLGGRQSQPRNTPRCPPHGGCHPAREAPDCHRENLMGSTFQASRTHVVSYWRDVLYVLIRVSEWSTGT